jgi:hypothetical protein
MKLESLRDKYISLLEEIFCDNDINKTNQSDFILKEISKFRSEDVNFYESKNYGVTLKRVETLLTFNYNDIDKSYKRLKTFLENENLEKFDVKLSDLGNQLSATANELMENNFTLGTKPVACIKNSVL